MKVCTRFIYHPKYWPGGGAERQMELIGKELLKSKVDFHYIAKKTFKTQKDFEIINGIKVHNIGYQIDLANSTFKERIFNMFYSYDFIIFLKFFKEEGIRTGRKQGTTKKKVEFYFRFFKFFIHK